MNNIHMLTVYLGSSGNCRPVFKDAARQLGTLIGQSGKKLVYGGMDAGLMGILAQSTLDAGGEVTGIIPERIKDSERMLHAITNTIMVEDLCDRKKRMFLMADAVIALPGGFGTLDESLEVLYWGNLGLHSKPLVLINIEGYWNELIAYLKTLHDFDERFLIVVDSVDEVIDAIEAHTPLPTVETPPHLPHFEDEVTRDTAQPLIIDRANIENTYFAVCALGLKQLGEHNRAIGFLNKDGRFDSLLSWIETAAKETFITQKCLKLFNHDKDEEALRALLKTQEKVEIDLHAEKWGARD